jgi:hypothetical protein
MGELEPWMDENFIKGVFLTAAAEQVNVKVIRDKNSGYVSVLCPITIVLIKDVKKCRILFR